MIMIDAALKRFVTDVDIIIVCEEEFLEWRILFTTIQVTRPELVVVADHPIHGVPEYDHQLGLVVRLPHPPRHAWSVEVSRSLLETNLSWQQWRHLVNIPAQTLQPRTSLDTHVSDIILPSCTCYHKSESLV